MPFKSDAQRRLMYVAAEGKSGKVPKSVARKFIGDSGAPLPHPEAPLPRVAPPVRGKTRKVKL